MSKKHKVLILGATGMLGHVLFKKFHIDSSYAVYGTVRNSRGLEKFFSTEELPHLISGIDADNFESVINAFRICKPDIVINCIGIIKHLAAAHDHVMSININALLPHRLANLCEIAGARLIHISTDCVFDGMKGNYCEEDLSNAEDLYGKTKYLGEVSNYNHAITLRTSIIGHELLSDIALVDWFLGQEKKVQGFSRAIYTGLSTYEMANVVLNYVIPNEGLNGLYHVASKKISKYELLKLISSIYNKSIEIETYPDFILDRSLLADKFHTATGYTAPSWPTMIANMYKYYQEWDCYKVKRSK